MPLRVETIGYSAENRPLLARRVGSEAASTRVFIIAGQHGDEPLAREAASRFIETFASSDMQIAALLDANPDGSQRNQRNNANGIDLNRDHQRLAAPETQAIHAFARKWKPHLIIDIHTYPPRRKHLVARGMVHANDVFLDIANNPTACEGMPWSPWLKKSLPRWIASVREQGLRCDRYTIITKSGRVRHSTPDVVDARNGVSLAHGVPAVLFEGREPTRRDDADAHRRTVVGLVAALAEVVDSAAGLPSLIAAEPSSLPDPLAIRSRYLTVSQPRELEFFDRQHQTVRHITLPDKYSPELQVTHRVTAPVAYAVDRRRLAILRLLQCHGIQTQCWAEEDHGAIGQIHIQQVRASTHSSRPPLRLRSYEMPFAGSREEILFAPVSPHNARLLAVLLEPHSKYAASRHRDLDFYPQADAAYPVLRVKPAEQAATAC